MQVSQEKTPRNRLTRQRIAEMWRFVRRFPSHPEALELFLASARETPGTTEADLSTLRTFFLASREAYLDNAAAYNVDRYLTTGIGAADLVLVPTILTMGVPDRPLFIALFALAISLVLVSSSLVLSFIKRELGITAYGKVHSNLVFLALVSGAAAMIATFWHVSSLVGKVFLILAVIAFVACTAFYAFARIGVGYARLKAAPPPTPPDSSEPTT